MAVILGTPTPQNTILYRVVDQIPDFKASLQGATQSGMDPNAAGTLNLTAGLVSTPLTAGTSEPSGDKAADEALGSLFSSIDI